MYKDYSGLYKYSDVASLYGDGNASEKIVNVIDSSMNVKVALTR